MPTSPHVIRLAGIWEIAPRVDDVAQDRGGEDSGSSHDAIEWTRVRLDRLEAEGLPFPPGACRRSFNRPTNLAVDQPVYLEWTGLRHAARILLNGRLAAETAEGAETVRVRIDDRLTERNEALLVLCPRERPSERDERAPLWPFRECRLLIEELTGERGPCVPRVRRSSAATAERNRSDFEPVVAALATEGRDRTRGTHVPRSPGIRDRRQALRSDRGSPARFPRRDACGSSSRARDRSPDARARRAPSRRNSPSAPRELPGREPRQECR
jgi:hypothetical protein